MSRIKLGPGFNRYAEAGIIAGTRGIGDPALSDTG